ncbi:hypothetical protein [Tistlia consotensis]|uniref:hypothetical protein n=1 Tax=Tistlia consotensis TaxID=1321365 RepID=UPI0015C5AE3F|nr:hypothetical protein [Tistlia consotensis]
MASLKFADTRLDSVAPPGLEASSGTDVSVALPVATGASLTAVTLPVSALVFALNAVVPPVEDERSWVPVVTAPPELSMVR